MGDSTPISIIRSGRVIAVDPFQDVLRSELTFSMVDFSMKRGGKISSQVRKEEMFYINPDNTTQALIPAGFTYRVCKKLNEAGFNDINYRDIRQLGLEQPDLSILDDLRDWQKEAVAAMLTSDGGTIWTSTASGKSFLIKKLVMVYPNTPIIITGHASQPLKAIYDDLCKDIKHEISASGVIGPYFEGRRVNVVHIRSLLKAPVDKAKILVYDESHGAAAGQRSELLSKVAFANMYGFSASASGRLDKKEPVSEGLFGPVIYKMPYTEALASGLVSKVSVHLYPTDGWERDYDTFYKRMLIGVVRNDERNRVIAEVARKHDDLKQIVYVMDNLEHVFRLKKLLPDHVPVYGSGSMTGKRWNQLKRLGLIPEGYSPLQKGEEFRIAEKFRRGEITKAIATSCWGEGVDFPDLDMLIRADGSPGKIEAIQVPGRVARKVDGKTEGIIVDFTDRFGRVFENRAKQRLAHYKKLGYEIHECVL